MTLETLLTLAVAAGLLVAGVIARLVIGGIVRLVRVMTGRPARRPRQAVPRAERGPSWIKRIADARQAGVAEMTVHPETSGHLDVMVRMSPVVLENGSTTTAEDKEAEPEMQLL